MKYNYKYILKLWKIELLILLCLVSISVLIKLFFGNNFIVFFETKQLGEMHLFFLLITFIPVAILSYKSFSKMLDVEDEKTLELKIRKWVSATYSGKYWVICILFLFVFYIWF